MYLTKLKILSKAKVPEQILQSPECLAGTVLFSSSYFFLPFFTKMRQIIRPNIEFHFTWIFQQETKNSLLVGVPTKTIRAVVKKMEKNPAHYSWLVGPNPLPGTYKSTQFYSLHLTCISFILHLKRQHDFFKLSCVHVHSFGSFLKL